MNKEESNNANKLRLPFLPCVKPEGFQQKYPLQQFRYPPYFPPYFPYSPFLSRTPFLARNMQRNSPGSIKCCFT